MAHKTGYLSPEKVFCHCRMHDYSSYPQQSRELNIKAGSSYLPQLPIGAEAGFHLFLRDTSFLNRNLDFGLLYPLEGNNYLKAFFKSEQSILLGFNRQLVIESKMLPNNIDWTNNVYGLEFNLEKLDYRFNPTKGIHLKLSSGFGNKKFDRNTELTALSDPEDTNFDFNSLYDSLNLKSLKTESHLLVDKYWQVGSTGVIKTGLQSAALFNDQLFQNELFRIGGYKKLRGFDEQSIFASWYNIFTLEYRYLIGTNSYFSAFWDGAYIQRKYLEIDEEAFPFGFGVGLNFETTAGIFGLNYAIGKQDEQPIIVRDAKIHFGYVNYF